MEAVKKIIKDRSGEGYIDVAVIVFCVMLVTALGVKLFPIFITKFSSIILRMSWCGKRRSAAGWGAKRPSGREYWRKRQESTLMFTGRRAETSS